MYGRICSILKGFAILNGRKFLRQLRCHGIYWASPSLLPALFPAFCCGAYSGRLELHVRNNQEALSALTVFLCAAGYNVGHTYDGARKVEAFASEDLEYPHFGHTVKRILRFAARFNGVLKEIIVFVSKSRVSGFLSIPEYPTTLFMIYVININVLYLYLTGNCQGLINLPFPQPPSLVIPTFVHLLSPFFDLKSGLVDWPEYLFHLCNMLFPFQDVNHQGVYITHDMFLSDSKSCH
ncbi:hypothetical protein H1R20_g16607, partial [Candolleomyces eurysporus]